VQTVKAFAHVASLGRHEYLQAPGKTQHGGRSKARIRDTSKPAWLAWVSSNRTPPGNCNTKPAVLADAAGSTTASSQRTASGGWAGSL
jgi:hypothetical protein